MVLAHTSEHLGQVFDAKYALGQVIAEGGMGVIYAARHLHTDRPVAVKVLHPRRAHRVADIRRFVHEARTTAQLRHPNIVEVLDIGDAQGRTPYFVMPILEGWTLAQALSLQTRPSPTKVLEWLLPIMGALAFAHRAGVVHRDVKPSNIFLRDVHGTIVPTLVDFGIARAAAHEDKAADACFVLGTPAYMAPEQLEHGCADPANDVWGMGVTFHQALTGNLPFAAGSMDRVAADMLWHRPASLLDHPYFPRTFGAGLDRALSRQPEERYSSMRNFARAILIGGLDADMDMPMNPDPIGLPEWTAWREKFAYKQVRRTRG